MKNNKITIVMYHYVRNLRHSRYPNIKGLDASLFIEQVDYLRKNYTIITMEQLIAALDNNESLPPKSVILTFDDAYIDHFTNVFPVLLNRKIQGSFYVPTKTVLKHEVLDVNKIHFILASAPDINKLIRRTLLELKKYRSQYQLNSDEFYFKKLAIANQKDTREVIFFKRLLQKELPVKLRKTIIETLFQEFVGLDEKTFSLELYMNKEQLTSMLDSGMHIGNHGYDHCWLNSLSYEQQKEEIRKGCSFLEDIGVDMQNWTMCYPYGGYDKATTQILQEFNCKLGITTKVGTANLANESRYELSRLDTNDLPKMVDAEVNEWHYLA